MRSACGVACVLAACSASPAPRPDLAQPPSDLAGFSSNPAVRLVFTTQPVGTRVDLALGAVELGAVDRDGQPAFFGGAVSLVLAGNAADATVRGVVLRDAVDGRVRFDDLSVDRVGSGFTLAASAAGVAPARSQPFDITAGVWAPIAQGLDGGAVRRLLLDGTLLYAATPSAGVFVSSDGGASWVPVEVALGDRRVRDLALDGNGTLFAATARGLWRRLRNAVAWTAIDLGPSLRDQPLFAVAVSGAVLYLATDGAIARSSDGGLTWSPRAQLPAVARLAVDRANPQVVFASDGAKVWKSSDGAATFAPFATGLPGAKIWSLDGDGDALYAGTAMGAFLLPAGGTAWSAFGGRSGAVFAIAPSPLDAGTRYLAADDGVWRSDAAGATLLGAPFPTLTALAIAQTTLYAGGGGVWKLVAGGSFAPARLGLHALEARDLAVDASARVFVAATTGLYRSTNQGGDWVAVTPGATPGFGALTVDGATLWALGDRAWSSSDGGASFTAAPSFDGCGWLRFDGAVGWCAPADPSVIGVYKIDGASRMLLAAGLGAHATQLAVGGATLWAATGDGLFRSSDTGASWTRAPLAGAVSAVTTDGATIYAAAADALYASSDGTTWRALSAQLGGATRLAAAGDDLWVAAGALYRSTDGGASFVTSLSGLRDTRVTAFARDTGGRAYAATDGNGVFRTTTSGL